MGSGGGSAARRGNEVNKGQHTAANSQKPSLSLDPPHPTSATRTNTTTMASSSVVQLESFVLSTLGASDVIPDSLAFAVSHSLDHKQVTSVLRSLAAAELVSIKETQNVKWTLTDEGKEYVKAGATPEVQVLKTIVALASKASEEKKEEENDGSGGAGG